MTDYNDMTTGLSAILYPSSGDRYYYFAASAGVKTPFVIADDIWKNDSNDNNRFSSRNFFNTHADAKAVLDVMNYLMSSREILVSMP